MLVNARSVLCPHVVCCAVIFNNTSKLVRLFSNCWNFSLYQPVPGLAAVSDKNILILILILILDTVIQSSSSLNRFKQHLHVAGPGRAERRLRAEVPRLLPLPGVHTGGGGRDPGDDGLQGEADIQTHTDRQKVDVDESTYIDPFLVQKFVSQSLLFFIKNKTKRLI